MKKLVFEETHQSGKPYKSLNIREFQRHVQPMIRSVRNKECLCREECGDKTSHTPRSLPPEATSRTSPAHVGSRAVSANRPTYKYAPLLERSELVSPATQLLL